MPFPKFKNYLLTNCSRQIFCKTGLLKCFLISGVVTLGSVTQRNF